MFPINKDYTYLNKLMLISSAFGKFSLLPVIMVFCADISANEQSHNTQPKTNQNLIEEINVVSTRSTLSVNNNLTVDNSYIETSDFTQAQTSLGDIISLTPGVSLNGQGGLFQSYNIRGFSRSRIKTEVNGVPIITDRRAGNSIAFIPSIVINSVDIKKGPSSTLYGSGAIGGAISVSTLNFDDSTFSTLINPQDNTVQVHTHLSNSRLSGNLLHRKAQNAYAPDTESTELFTQHKQQLASIAYQFSWNNIDVLATTLYSSGQDLGKSSSEFQTSRNTIYPEDRHIISKFQWSKGEQWQFSIYHHGQRWHSDIDRLSIEFSDDELTDVTSVTRRNITRYTSDTFGSLATLILDESLLESVIPSTNTSWINALLSNTLLGAEWIGRRNINISEEEFDSNNAFVFNNDTVNANEDNIGLFVNKTWHPDNLTINAGIRYDWLRVKQQLSNNTLQATTVQDDFLSLSLNTQYQVSQNTQLTLSVANAFRFPTVSELFFLGETPRGTTLGNSSLAPEESVGGQIALQHQYNHNIFFNISSYYYQVENYIERFSLEVDENDNDIRSFRNIDEVTIKGFEISTHWQIYSGLNSQFSYQKQQARDINNSTVDDTIPEAIKAQLFWTPSFKQQNVEFDTQLIYQLKKNDIGDSEQILPSEFIWNANINIQLSYEHKLSFVFFNLTNNTYRTSADEDAPYAKERNIAIKWQWQFN